MLLRKYEMPWRRAYEAYAGLAWALASVFFIFAIVRAVAPWPLTAGLALLCVMLAFHRSGQALGVLTVRASLCGRAMAFITPNALRKLCADPKQVFLGFGFEWQPVHSQRLYELAKVNFRDLAVTPWLLRLLGHEVHPQPDYEIGLAYIHGVEAKERSRKTQHLRRRPSAARRTRVQARWDNRSPTGHAGGAS